MTIRVDMESVKLTLARVALLILFFIFMGISGDFIYETTGICILCDK